MAENLQCYSRMFHDLKKKKKAGLQSQLSQLLDIQTLEKTHPKSHFSQFKKKREREFKYSPLLCLVPRAWPLWTAFPGPLGFLPSGFQLGFTSARQAGDQRWTEGEVSVFHLYPFPLCAISVAGPILLLGKGGDFLLNTALHGFQ